MTIALISMAFCSSIFFFFAFSSFFSSLDTASFPRFESCTSIEASSSEYFASIWRVALFKIVSYSCLSCSVNFLKNNKLGFTVAPEAINTSCGMETISRIFALHSTKSRTFWRFELFKTPSGRTIPILPPGFSRFKQRSMKSTSVSPLSILYRSNRDSPIWSLTCFKASV